MTAIQKIESDVKYAIGLDIGDGESCLVWINTTDPHAHAQVYRRLRPPETTVLTALARRRRELSREPSSWIFGEAALLSQDSIQFVVNFKKPPSAPEARIPDAVLFAHEFLREFFAAHPEVEDDCLILVGHPTGWPPEECETYSHLLRINSLQIALLPESQSALVHVWDRRRLSESSDPSQDVDNVLVIDVGSSTVDVTMVTGLEPANIEAGSELGCADIDRELASLAKSALAADSEFCAAMKPEDAENLLLLACRRAKEAQFAGQPFMLHDNQDVLSPRFKAIVGPIAGWLRLLDIPLIVERRWAHRFRALLLEVGENLNIAPEVVVLTGGGSRMPITHVIAKEVFPGASIEQDETPSLSVGRGLASAGRHRIEALRFRRAATGVATMPEVTQALREATVTAFTSVRGHTYETLKRSNGTDWPAILASPPGMDEAVRDLEATIDGIVRPLINDVCDRFSIPHGKRDLAAKIAPPRPFTADFVNRVSVLPGRPEFPFEDSLQMINPVAAQFMMRHIGKGVQAAGAVGARGLATKLFGAAKAGGQAAVVIGAVAVAVAGTAWTVDMYRRRSARLQALAVLADMELPDEYVAAMEGELAREIAAVVESRIEPLERMVGAPKSE